VINEVDEWFVLPFGSTAPFGVWVDYCVEVATCYDMGVVEFFGYFVIFFILRLSSGGMQGHVACDYAKLLAVDWYVQACASAWDNHIELGV
jgi:hypothetical protein